MQTPTLPIQVSGASANANPARANANANADAGQFSQALSREIENRQNNKPAPVQAQAKPVEAAKQPARQDDSVAPASSSAGPAPGPAASSADAKDATPTKSAGADDAADAAAATPVADLLALVASFNLPVQIAVTAVREAAPADALATAAAVPVDPLAAAAVTAAADAATDTGDATAFQDQLAQAGASLKVDAQAASDVADAAAKAATLVLPAGARASDKDAAATELKTVAAPAADAAAPAAEAMVATVAAPLAAEAKPVVKSDAPVVRNAGTETLAVQPGDGKKALAADAAAQAKPQPELAQPAALRPREAAAEPVQLKEAPVAAPVVAQVQQASLQAVQATNGAATDKIGARVGTPAWDNQVGQKIVWMVAGKEQSASLTLNPPDMGPMQVVLSVNNDQATVTFSSAQPEVRQALENAMPRLREMMGESGISLGNATVNAGMPDQRQAQGGSEQPRGNGAQAGRFDNNGSASEAAARNDARPASRSGALGAVDTFA